VVLVLYTSRGKPPGAWDGSDLFSRIFVASSFYFIQARLVVSCLKLMWPVWVNSKLEDENK
jgi:hypothetical protein